ncbi:hypothetical protein OROGR_018095 [Orobanche gracilis]
MSCNVDAGVVSRLWGGMGFEYEKVDSVGNSGGLLSVWDPKFLRKDRVLKGDNFPCVSGLLSDGLMRLNMVNVYAPQTNGDKRDLWTKLSQVIQAEQGWWIVLGDFNAVREPDERKNSCFDLVCARDFNDFLDNTGLREYNLKALIREHSDHAPLCLSLIDTNFGPKPFRWFDSWFDRPGCEDVVKSALLGWNNVEPPDVNLINKLGVLRAKLRGWIAEWKNKDKEDENRLNEEKEDMERLMEQKELDEAELWVWSECKKSIQEIENLRTRDLKQKSRVKWAALGDENTSFFHSMINGRKARNAIPGLEIRGDYFEGIVGDGSSIRFWMDSWLHEDPLRLLYPHLFRLEKQKWSLISDRLKVENNSKILQWDWRSNPATAAEITELFNLMNVLYNFVWKGGKDTWKWKASKSGEFSVSSARGLLAAAPRPINQPIMPWKGWIPLKCKIMVWRSLLNRLPTKAELFKRGVILQSCCFSAEVWHRVEVWKAKDEVRIFVVFRESPVQAHPTRVVSGPSILENRSRIVRGSTEKLVVRILVPKLESKPIKTGTNNPTNKPVNFC